MSKLTDNSNLMDSPLLQRYFIEIEKHQILSREEEECLYPTLHTAETKQKLINSNLKLALKYARKYAKISNGELQEFISEANYGLTIAAERFDGSLGYRFSTYAHHWIRNRLLKLVAEQNSVVTHSANKFYSNAKEQRGDHTDAPVKRDYSIDDPNHMVELQSSEDWCQSSTSDENPLESNLDKIQEAKKLLDHMDSLTTLSERENICLKMAYGLIEGETHTTKEISKQMGLSQAGVAKVRRRALKKLRDVYEFDYK